MVLADCGGDVDDRGRKKTRRIDSCCLGGGKRLRRGCSGQVGCIVLSESLVVSSSGLVDVVVQLRVGVLIRFLSVREIT